MGRDPYDLLAHYGFVFKTEIYWHKVGRKGTGYWLRGEVEKLLIGVRGSVKAWRHNRANWFEEPGSLLSEVTYLDEPFPVGIERSPTPPHSRKPAAIRDLLTTLTPGARRVELYATERAEGWDSYGLDLDPAHDVLTPEFWEAIRARPLPEDVPEALSLDA